MNRKQLHRLGLRAGPALDAAVVLALASAFRLSRLEIRRTVQAIIETPQTHREDQLVSGSAGIAWAGDAVAVDSDLRAPWCSWGHELDPADPADQAGRLPIPGVRSCRMPRGASSRSAGACRDGASPPPPMGQAIACRVGMSSLDSLHRIPNGDRPELFREASRRRRFGVGATFSKPRQHAVMDEDWGNPVTRAEEDGLAASAVAAAAFVSSRHSSPMRDRDCLRGVILVLSREHGSRGSATDSSTATSSGLTSSRLR